MRTVEAPQPHVLSLWEQRLEMIRAKIHENDYIRPIHGVRPLEP
jgi:hypothetical protein